MTTITGQKAVATYSSKDISNFKLRKGVAIGVRVTLRGNKMYEFLDRLIAAALPRIRDFKGVNEKGFDGRGNYTLGVTEQIIFPEIDIDKVTKMNGMDITFVTSASSDNEAFELLKEFGIPFKNKKKINNGKRINEGPWGQKKKLAAQFAEKRAAFKKAGEYNLLQTLPKILVLCVNEIVVC